MVQHKDKRQTETNARMHTLGKKIDNKYRAAHKEKTNGEES